MSEKEDAAIPRRLDEIVVPSSLHFAEHWEATCDGCKAQEGSHYCLLHSVLIKNMDIMTCDDIELKL